MRAPFKVPARVIRSTYHLFSIDSNCACAALMFQVRAAVLCVLLLSTDPLCNAELVSVLFSVGTLIAGGGLLTGVYKYKCHIYECCQDERWMPANFTGLRAAFKSQLYGQHLVVDTVVRALKGHFENEKPRKALVLSFHGWTGCGKNYVSNIIARHLYTKGMHSSFVHLFISTLHFPLSDSAELYADQLHQWIIGNVTNCARSLFIFDELDKLNPRVLEAIKPFIDHHENIVEGADFRKSVFIFLSNSGGTDISQHTLQTYIDLKPRESIQLVDMERVITTAAFNEKGGLQFSELIRHHLVDHFIPFLPLAREHVRLCVRDDLESRGVEPTESRVTQVADMLQYFPMDLQLYSKSGCKRIAQKVELILQEEEDESLRLYSHNDEL